MKKTMVGTGLKLLLKSQNMKQYELAQALDVSQAMVSHWVTGKLKLSVKTQEEILKVIREKNEAKVANPTPTEYKVKEVISHSMTLEEKINTCKKYCLDTYGFEVVVVK